MPKWIGAPLLAHYFFKVGSGEGTDQYGGPLFPKR